MVYNSCYSFRNCNDKTAMYYIEIDKGINKIAELFRLVGMWPIEDESTDYGKMGCKVLFLMFYMSFVASLIAGGLLSADRSEFVYLIALGLTSLVSTIKLVCFYSKKHEIRAFIQRIGIHSTEDYEEYRNVSAKVKNFLKFSFIFYLAMCIIDGLLLILSLLVFSSEKRLPINIWFPLDWKNDAASYWIAFSFVLFGIVSSVFTVIFNIIVWYLMMNCAIKYQILGNQFRNMFLKKSTAKNWKIAKGEEENLFFRELIGLINVHQNIKEYFAVTYFKGVKIINFLLPTRTIDRFKSCFANLFFTQIITSGTSICCSVYALSFATRNETLIQCSFYVLVLIYNTLDVFSVMYFGNEIQFSSDRLSYCVFQSNWLHQSKPCKMNLIILMEVLKQPKELMVGKLYPLNMRTFTSIVNAAYSMFNILKSLN